MKYDYAKAQLEMGKSIYRDGWNPMGWVSLVSENVKAGFTIPTAKENKLAFYNASDSDGSHVPYEPTDEDQKAEDWHVWGEPDPQEPVPPKDDEPKKVAKPIPAKAADKKASKSALTKSDDEANAKLDDDGGTYNDKVHGNK